ncbi:MAG: transporter [Elusimicrobiota bacterium]
MNALLRAMLTAVLAAGTLRAEEAKGPIEDNSFLVEEAYNQEPGVIQHIQAWQYLKTARTWGYAFTEEWPVPGRRHQLSITLPAAKVSEPDRVSGLGALALNYRLQAVDSETAAFAPRVSLVLPTGDYRKGLGNGAPGLQFNLPMSVRLSPEWIAHWNMGATATPGGKEPGGAKADLLGFNYGTSFIWQPVRRFNLMLEAAWSSAESVDPTGTKERGDAFFLSPGFRFAVDVGSLQIVPGVAVPIGLGPSRAEHGIFTYLSFEHPFF